MEKRLFALVKLTKKIYDDYLNEIINEDFYQDLIKEYQLEQKQVKDKYNLLNTEKEKNRDYLEDIVKVKTIVDEYLNFDNLTREMITKLIERIEIKSEGPLVIDKQKGKIRALIERNNPNWLAPYNLRFTNSIKLDLSSKDRWLTIGCYHYDGTQIAIDFKNNSIVAMYNLPVTITVKELRKMKESDYEKMIICEWENFESFFISETKRLSKVVKSNKNISLSGFTAWKKTLPINHKDFEK